MKKRKKLIQRPHYFLMVASIYLRAPKGGRDRILHNPSQKQIDAVKKLAPFIGKNGNSWPDGLSEASWEKYVYKIAGRIGLCIKTCGASLHGLRHAYAQARYKDLTNLYAPCLYSSPSDYREAAHQEYGDTWRNRHDQAINILAHELGHNRGEITATYLGTIMGKIATASQAYLPGFIIYKTPCQNNLQFYSFIFH